MALERPSWGAPWCHVGPSSRFLLGLQVPDDPYLQRKISKKFRDDLILSDIDFL
jgi:hypothetical protein